MTMEEEKTADKKEPAKDSVKAFGKGMEPWGAPFGISRQSGLYYYVPAGHFDRLQELNRQAGNEGLPAINVVGRGGVPGNRPFVLGGGLYVCVLAEHVRRLQEIMRGTVETEIAPAIERFAKPMSAKPIPSQEGFASVLEGPTATFPNPSIVKKEMKAAIADNPEPITVQEIAPVVEKEGIMPDDAKITTAMPEMAVQEQRQTVLTAEEMRDRDGEEKKEQRPEGRYVYCIINTDGKQAKSFGKIGLGSEEVYCIDYKNVSAVVSDFEGIDCGLSEENARVHNEVISHVMTRIGSALPVGFGAVFASRKILKGVLGKTYHVLKKEMEGVKDRVELGIKMVANRQQGAKSPVNNAPEEVLDALGKIAAKTHRGKAFMERMLLNASFLVERGRIDEFSRQVEELEKKYSDAVKIQYTGPWPPYNFVSVRIGANTDGGG